MLGLDDSEHLTDEEDKTALGDCMSVDSWEHVQRHTKVARWSAKINVMIDGNTYPVMTHGTWAKALKSETRTGMAVATMDWSNANIWLSALVDKGDKQDLPEQPA